RLAGGDRGAGLRLGGPAGLLLRLEGRPLPGGAPARLRAARRGAGRGGDRGRTDPGRVARRRRGGAAPADQRLRRVPPQQPDLRPAAHPRRARTHRPARRAAPALRAVRRADDPDHGQGRRGRGGGGPRAAVPQRHRDVLLPPGARHHHRRRHGPPGLGPRVPGEAGHPRRAAAPLVRLTARGAIPGGRCDGEDSCIPDTDRTITQSSMDLGGSGMEERPWTALYPQAVTEARPVRHASLAEAWRDRVRREPDARAITYFDGVMTVREVDGITDALAAAFRSLGTRRGDRVGVYLQNIPQFA